MQRTAINFLLSLFLLACLPVWQAKAVESIIEEITVTAQKREQNLQDVPIAITAFSGEQMRALGVSQSIDIAAFTPGVHISGNLAGQNTQFSIRGVTQNDFNDIIEAPTAVYLDEGYLAIAQAQTFAVFDVQRVEILKGPRAPCLGVTQPGAWFITFQTSPVLMNPRDTWTFSLALLILPQMPTPTR